MINDANKIKNAKVMCITIEKYGIIPIPIPKPVLKPIPNEFENTGGNATYRFI